MKEAMIPIKQTPEYRQGYSEGYSEGRYQAILQFQSALATQKPRIIITTEENLERIKKEYNI